MEPLSESDPIVDNYLYDGIPALGLDACFVLPLPYDDSSGGSGGGSNDDIYDMVQWAVSPVFTIPPTHTEEGK